MKVGIWMLCIFCAVLIAFSLYSPTLIGLSDNGDFARIMEPNRIQYEEEREPYVFQSRFVVTYEGDTPAQKLYNLLFTLKTSYFTTHNIFIKASLLLNVVANIVSASDLRIYNIFWLGIIYAVLTLGALTLIFSQTKVFMGEQRIKHIIFCLLLTVMVCDSSYMAYFHSFYGEPVQYVAFLWIAAGVVGVIASKKHKLGFSVLFFMSVAVFSGAKFANIPQGILLSLGGLSFLLYFINKNWQRFVILGCFVFTLLPCSLLFENIPEKMDQQTTYQSIFYGVLKGSQTPQEDLAQLGLPKEYSALANTNAYMPGHKIDIKSEEFENRFYKHISKVDVLKFYLKNPTRFIEKLSLSCLNSAHIRPVYLGNYNSSYERLKVKDGVSLWSRLRLLLPLNKLWFTALFFVMSGSLAIYKLIGIIRRRTFQKKHLLALIFFTSLLIINAMNLIIPVVANGEADLAKHMFSYVMGLDLQVMILVLWGVWKISRKSRCIQLNTAFMLMTAVLSIFVLNIDMPPMNKEGIMNTGDYIQFGSLDLEKDEPILWRVIKKENASVQLLSVEPVAYGAFDNGSDSAIDDGSDQNRKKYGSNYWPESHIREWLNFEFLNAFSSKEQGLIQQHTHDCILSAADKHKATKGDNEFFWTHNPQQVDFGAGEAYRVTATDRVFLLNVSEFSGYIAKGGLEKRPQQSYWLETPYYNNSSMVRVVGEDGYVYMKDAAFAEIGIRPSIIIHIGRLSFSGKGSLQRPYNIVRGTVPLTN